jgi:Flp pilus assembly protein TadB
LRALVETKTSPERHGQVYGGYLLSQAAVTSRQETAPEESGDHWRWAILAVLSAVAVLIAVSTLMLATVQLPRWGSGLVAATVLSLFCRSSAASAS